MRRETSTIPGAALLFLLSPAVWAQHSSPIQPAQQPPPQQSSVVEAARRAREQKKKAPKTTKLFDNDNIPKVPENSSQIGAPAAPQQGSAGSAPRAAGKPQAEPKTPGQKKDEKYWRKRFAAAQTKLHRAEGELAVLQRELEQLQVQYYPDPTKAMQQQYSRTDINEKSAQIAAKQKEVDQLKQQLSDLEDALRKSGGDPGWARE